MHPPTCSIFIRTPIEHLSFFRYHTVPSAIATLTLDTWWLDGISKFGLPAALPSASRDTSLGSVQEIPELGHLDNHDRIAGSFREVG